MSEYQLTPRILQYLPLLAAGDSLSLIELFASQPAVDDPLRGHVEGPSAVQRYATETCSWLAERQAHVQIIATTQTATGAVSEAMLHLMQDETRILLPVAVAADLTLPEALLRAARVYHSLWPLFGHLGGRPPLLQADASLTLPDVVGRYYEALTRGETETIVHLFQPDGVVHEPSMGDYIHQGRDKLRAFYNRLFEGGGVRLELCRVIDDGVRCAVEYNMIAWGQQQLPPQASLSVYERGPTGLLAAARMYNDVFPPVGD